MSTCKAAVTTTNYQSYLVTPYNSWFRALGYPLLDVRRYEDGEWAIIQYLRSPVVPAVTPWNHVLTGLRHVDLSLSVCEKYANQLDVEKRHVWAEQERFEAEAIAEAERSERHTQMIAEKQHEAIVNNPGLMNRIARNGLHEINLFNIAKHAPLHHFRKK